MAISAGTALLSGGILQGVGSLFGSGKSSSAAVKAAQIQAQAAEHAADLQMQMFQQIQGNMQPYMQAGQSALGTLMGQLPQLTSMPSTWGMSTEFSPTQASLYNTPGYQFTLGQGQQAVQNSLAAQGLGRSGPAVKGAADYTAGLASTTFNQQYQNWLAGQQMQLGQKQQAYNMLGGISGSGQNASANLGALGLQATTGATNALTSGAAATAGGIVGSANALNAGLAGAGNAASSTAMMYAMMQGGMFGPQGGAPPAAAPNSLMPWRTD